MKTAVKIETIKVSEIVPNENNPRIIKEDKFERLVESIKTFPEMLHVRPLVIDENNVVLGGNMRLKACIEAGLKDLPVIRCTNWSEERKSEFIIKDNVGFGEWDWNILANEWDVHPLVDWGLDVWETEPEEVEGLTDEDAVPEAPSEPITKLGDVWILGEHRVMCGDSTSKEAVEILMDGEKADMVFTDPPYGISLGHETQAQAKARDRRTDGLIVINDELRGEGLEQFLTNALSLADTFLRQGGAFYVCSPIDAEVRKFITAIENVGWHYQSGLVWNKSSMSLSRHDYHPKHEIIHYGWKLGSAHLWLTDRKQTTVKDFDKPSRSKLHPTMKPVGLIEYYITNVSSQGICILDLFLGSGSTLIAAEKTKRKCYGMELDPKYCDVIVKRWEDFTGKKATREIDDLEVMTQAH